MTYCLAALFAQCPCSGGSGGGDSSGSAPWLLLLVGFGTWLLVRSIWKKEGSTTMGKAGKLAIVLALVAIVAVVLVMKKSGASIPVANSAPPAVATQAAAGLPRLVDLGSTSCIPCKMMAPILEELKKEYAGRMQVEFIDVTTNAPAAEPYGIKLIPTQVFFDAAGKERWRHEGFISKDDILAKWKELGVSLGSSPAAASQPASVPAYERLEGTKTDSRAKDSICYMCDGDIDAKTAVIVKTDKGDVRLCGLHHYFVLYTSLAEDKSGFEKKAQVADWSTDKPVALTEASIVYGLDEKTGRPTIKAFADRDAAAKERQASGGNVVDWKVLQDKELANRCAFCDRAVYPEDAALVKIDGVYGWGCCSHCAIGVAARTGKDIEVHEHDLLSGDEIVVKTAGGSVALLHPPTAIAWFGLHKGADGKFTSAGCFHQGFFVNSDNLKKWIEQNPLEVGRLISIQQALSDKTKLTAEQIQKACKIGECAPK